MQAILESTTHPELSAQIDLATCASLHDVYTSIAYELGIEDEEAEKHDFSVKEVIADSHLALDWMRKDICYILGIQSQLNECRNLEYVFLMI